MPEALLVDATPEEVEQFRTLSRICGFRPRKHPDGSFILLEEINPPTQMMELVPLQKDGASEISPAAVSRVFEQSFVQPAEDTVSDVRSIIEGAISTFGFNRPLGPMESWRFQFLLEKDPTPILREIAEADDNLRLYGLVPTETLSLRNMLWRAFSGAVEDGLSWHEARAQGGFREPDVTSGQGLISPARLVGAPLVARNQPLAMIFDTVHIASVLVVPTEGAFVRGVSLGNWPTGGGTPSLAGDPYDLYGTEEQTFPPGHALDVLQQIVAGGNSALDGLSNPLQWTSGEDGMIDVIGRTIAWSSVEFGLGAVSELGDHWPSEETIWTAFRALGMLEGIWPKTRSLRPLLTPEMIRKYAVSPIRDPFLKSRSANIVDAYERDLLIAYNVPIEKCIDQLVYVRNVLHGTGPSNPSSRMQKLMALRTVERARLARLKDIATMWWMSIFESPATLAPPNQPDFTTG